MKQLSPKTRILSFIVIGAMNVLIGAVGTVRHRSMGVFYLILGAFWIGMGIYSKRVAGRGEISLSLRSHERD